MQIHPLQALPAARRHQTAGGVLIVAMLLTAAATLGFAAWATLLNQRQQSAEETMGGIQRRLAFANGRQMAIQLGYNQLMTQNTGNAIDLAQYDTTLTAKIHGSLKTDAWTGSAISKFPLPYPAVNNSAMNRFSPSGTHAAYGPEFSFTVKASVMDYYPNPTVRTDANNAPVSIAAGLITSVRHYAPLLSGDLLCIYKPTLGTATPLANQTLTGNIRVVGGRSLILTPAPLANFSALRTDAISTPHYNVPSNPIIFQNTASTPAQILPSNFPSIVTSLGSVGTGNNLDTQHRLNVIDDATNNPSNSLKARILSSDVVISINTAANHALQDGVSFDLATGVLNIDLANQAIWGIVADNNVSEIRLQGMPAINSNLASVRLCYTETAGLYARTLTKISCQGDANYRPIIIAVKKSPNPTGSAVVGPEVTLEYPTTTPLWHSLIVVENTPLIFTTNGILTLAGGIMTDASLTGPTGQNRVQIIPSTLSTFLTHIAPQRMWLETYFDYGHENL